MKVFKNSESSRFARALIFLAALLPVVACSDSSSSSKAYIVRSTTNAVDGTTTMVSVGIWLVYFADETFSNGTDLNGDMDTLDDVAVAVNMSALSETPLRAAQSAAIVGGDIYLEVDEARDGTDWDGDMVLDDIVLLHWSSTTGVTTFVSLLSSEFEDVAMVAASGRLYFTAEAMTTGDETSLQYVSPAAPTTPVIVMNTIGGGTLEPIIMGEEDGLLFCFVDEVQETADLNGDMDQLDGFVLALLDTTNAAARVLNVGLAVQDEDAPFAAFVTGVSDWLVGFLVDEADQGATNLNAQALFAQPLVPTPCAGTPDIDTTDQVLHYVKVADFAAAMPNALINTGLAGTGRVVAVSGYVGTISSEADATCDLNQDMDSTDFVARWIQANATFDTMSMLYTGAPPRDPSQMYALKTSLPGGSMGLATLGNRLIAVVDEAADSRNSDGKSADHDLVAWLETGSGFSAAWNFAHQRAGVPSHGTGIFDSSGASEPYAGASWMAAEESNFRLAIAFQEEVPGTNPLISSLNNNVACQLVVKDADLTDSLPTWCDFEAGPTMDFDGLGFAINANNMGMVITSTHAYFRLSEAADNIDHNLDGDKSDNILMRNPLASCNPIAMAAASGVVGPIVFTDGTGGAAFFASEFQAGIDLNGDGDTADEVVQYFLF